MFQEGVFRKGVAGFTYYSTVQSEFESCGLLLKIYRTDWRIDSILIK
jgi:hypothetical protein